jgi:hypothetical protein
MFRPIWPSSDVKIKYIKQTTENNKEHNTPSTTYVRIEGTHTIAAEYQQFPPLDFNT